VSGPGTTTWLGPLVFAAIGAGFGCSSGSSPAIHDGGGSGPGSDARDGVAGHSVVDGASDPTRAADAGSSDAGSGDAATTPGDASAAIAVTVMLSETMEAFRNPMEGFRPSRYIGDAAFPEQEYASTYKHYVPYAALESSATDTAQKIKDWSDANWAGLREHNLKVIPRVVIVCRRAMYPST